MGCTSSKLDDLPAVELCRDRCKFLDEAIHLRFAFAEAHFAYVQSLKVIGTSLHDFIQQNFSGGVGEFFPSPTKLNLPPTRRKGDSIGSEDEVNSLRKKALHSHSNSGSHLNFHSDSEDGEEDDSDSHSFHRSGHSSPLHHTQIGGQHVNYDMIPNQESMMRSYPGEFLGLEFRQVNYMKKHTTASVVYQQKPTTLETVYFGESSSSSTSYNQQYPYSAYDSNQFFYPNYGGGAGYYGAASVPPYGFSPPRIQAESASSSKPPPAPPSPPKASAWDFVNPFEAYDRYSSKYTPTRDTKEVREEEEVPDLEDEEYQHEVVKGVGVDQKFVADGGRKHSKSAVEEENDEDREVDQTRPFVESRGMKYDVNMVEKKRAVDDDERVRDVSEVAVEIKVQFERASESGNEIAKILEVGKLPYHGKHSTYWNWAMFSFLICENSVKLS